MKNIKPAKPGGWFRYIVRNLAITIAVGIIYFYFKLPAINLQNPEFYSFFILLAAVFCVLSVISQGLHKADDPKQMWAGIKKNCFAPLLACAALVVIFLIGNLISAPIFRAGSYRELLTVETGNFTDEVDEISFDHIPMLDSNSAKKLGDRKMGELVDMVSQFEVADNYTQINYKGHPVRVTPLAYGDIIKWFNNTSEGLPAYIVIDMVTQEVEVVRLEEDGGMKYAESEYFWRNVYRHLRFQYPTYMFDTATFEIDEEGTPYWVCPRIVKRIGLFGGTDIQGAVLMNALTGECVYYEDTPSWVDRVYSAELIVEQYDYYGTFQHGFINSIFGQRNVTVTTSGYNYIALGDDVYMYTGITSVSADQSNLGFILTNQRTKETRYYECAGATEESAQASARGVVQQYSYDATFPLLLNISNQPTYFMALKDEAGLVKMYAMVNVQQYQIVAYATTVAECETNYIKLLEGNDIAVPDTSKTPTELHAETGKIKELRSAVVDGNTRVYILLEGRDYYYVVSVADSEKAAILSVGDTVTVHYSQTDGELRAARGIE